MSSAVLNRIESTFMRNPPFSNPYLDPNPNHRKHNFPNCRVTDESVAIRQQSTPDDASSFDRNVSMPARSGQFDQGEYQTLNMGSYTLSEKKKLKKRLMMELDQVRSLTSRIETAEQYCVGPSTSSQSLPNRKFPSKKISGTKRPFETVSRKGSKPVALGKLALGSLKHMKMCRQLLMKLMKHKLGWIFNTPVDVVGLKLHDYYQIVEKPMDLGTIKMKLGKKMYESPTEFAADVRLTFNNAMLYNPKGHDVHTMAEQLLSMFEGLFRPINEEYEFEVRQRQQDNYQKFYSDEELPESSWNNSETLRAPDRLAGRDVEALESAGELEALKVIETPAIVDVAVPKTVQVPSLVPTSPRIYSPVKPMPRGKLPKPKAKDPNKREMSNEEKFKLGAELEALPEEKMAQVLQIVQKRNAYVIEDRSDDDAVVLDIEKLDRETLWELDRFVVNWRKALGKIRKQGLGGNTGSQPNDGEVKAVSDVEVNTEGYGGGKTAKGDDEDVDIGDEMPMSSFPPVEIEKDEIHDNGSQSSSSSGSSSRGSSSSSGSDLGSSSGSETDAEVD